MRTNYYETRDNNIILVVYVKPIYGFWIIEKGDRTLQTSKGSGGMGLFP